MKKMTRKPAYARRLHCSIESHGQTPSGHGYKANTTISQSFILATLPYTIILPPLILYTLNLLTLRSTHFFTTLPNGPTALIFALLAQYHAAIPDAYRYRVSSPLASPLSTASRTNTNTPTNAQSNPSTPNQDEDNDNSIGIILSSKSLSYLPAFQLALSSLPGSLIPAITGWLIGYAWRWEMLPYPVGSDWRISDRLWGFLGGTKTGARAGQGVEGLRRRMESEAVGEDGEGRATTASVQGAGAGAGGRLRGWGVESMLGGGGSRIGGGAASDRARRMD